MRSYLTRFEMEVLENQALTKSTEQLKKEAAEAIEKNNASMTGEEVRMGWSVTKDPKMAVPIYIYGKRLLEENNVYAMDILDRLGRKLDELKEVCLKHRVVAEMGKYLNQFELLLSVCVSMVFDEDMKAIVKDDIVDRTSVGHYICHVVIDRDPEAGIIVKGAYERKVGDKTVDGMFR